MKKSWLPLPLLAACCLFTAPAFADVPHLIRYQGTAVDRQGVALEGPYTLTFRLYDAATDGTKVWEETQPDVPITKGHFSVLLGSVTPLTSMDWAQPCWLAILVNGEELLPRQPITSVPLAIRAETAEVVKTSGLTDDAHGLVPQGAILLWNDSACPNGYARLSALDGKFLVSSASYNPTAGGSNTHDHGGQTGHHVLTIDEIPSHAHSIAGRRIRKSGSDNEVAVLENTGDVDRGAYTEETSAMGGGNGHAHLMMPADNRPEFATVVLCQKQ